MNYHRFILANTGAIARDTWQSIFRNEVPDNVMPFLVVAAAEDYLEHLPRPAKEDRAAPAMTGEPAIDAIQASAWLRRQYGRSVRHQAELVERQQIFTRVRNYAESVSSYHPARLIVRMWSEDMARYLHRSQPQHRDIQLFMHVWPRSRHAKAWLASSLNEAVTEQALQELLATKPKN